MNSLDQITPQQKTYFAQYLLDWYDKNKRKLPWRDTKDPYKIWLSEIILQQTRVDQGMPYYRAFIETFPRIQDLAHANEEQVLRLWQGLGYYTRARNLHRCAKYIYDELGGNFPKTYAELIKLPGIGPYTAAAIASFAFDEATAVVDGNVFRVLARVWGIQLEINSTSGKKTFTNLANELVPANRVGDYNQAIMEFGALHCQPKGAKCGECGLASQCHALQHKLVDKLPLKKKKPQARQRYLNYFIIGDGERFWLRQRQDKDIWKNLFEFYLIESEELVENFEIFLPKLKPLFPDFVLESKSRLYKHVLSHQHLHVRFYHLNTPNACVENVLPSNYSLYTIEEIRQLPKPILIHKYLEHCVFSLNLTKI